MLANATPLELAHNSFSVLNPYLFNSFFHNKIGLLHSMFVTVCISVSVIVVNDICILLSNIIIQVTIVAVYVLYLFFFSPLGFNWSSVLFEYCAVIVEL